MTPGQVYHQLRIFGMKHVPHYAASHGRADGFWTWRDILSTPFIADWGSIMIRKKIIIDKNNQLENKTCKPHTYITRDKVLVRKNKSNKYKETYVSTNRIVTMRRGAVQERINIISGRGFLWFL